MKFDNLINLLIACFFSILMLILTACAGDPMKLYEGRELPESILSHIIVDWTGAPTCHFTISTRAGDSDKALTRINYYKPLRSKPFRLLPGKYSVHFNAVLVDHIRGYVYHKDGLKYFDIGRKPFNGALCSVNFNIDAGKTFIVKILYTTPRYVTEKDLNNAGEKGLYVERRHFAGPNKEMQWEFISLKMIAVDKITGEIIDSCAFVSTDSLSP